MFSVTATFLPENSVNIPPSMLKCTNFKPESLRNGVYVTAINVSDYRYLVKVYFIDVTIRYNFDPLCPTTLK